MLPAAYKLKALLYAADWYNGDVYVYDYKTGTLVGTLTGFDEPMGSCEDAKGDVWITSFDGNNAIEYAHGGTSPLKTLATLGYSNGCSISPHGDLAVTNVFAGSGAGNVQIFKNASGSPTEFANASQCYYLSPAGYDDKGNLYTEASSKSGNSVCELASGGTSLQLISFNQTIHAPGSIMWDGKYITLTDALYNGGGSSSAIYQATRSASGGLVLAGTTVLSDSCVGADVFQPFVAGTKNTPVEHEQGSVVIGSETLCSSQALGVWHYTTGGDPFSQFSGEGALLYPSVSFSP
jgi:hypothetical protein